MATPVARPGHLASQMPLCTLVPEGEKGVNVNTARKYLIPFPAPAVKTPSVDDTIYAMPRPEILFQPTLRRFHFPALRIPRQVSLRFCLAGVVAAAVAGMAAGRMTASPPLSAPIYSQAIARLTTGQAMPVAAVTVFPAPIVRTQKIPFQLTQEQGFQRVGPFLLKLKKADEKRQTFTLTLQTKDNRVELQDRALAETIRLNPNDQGQSEILVQRIDDNRIEGFMRVQTVTR